LRFVAEGIVGGKGGEKAEAIVRAPAARVPDSDDGRSGSDVEPVAGARPRRKRDYEGRSAALRASLAVVADSRAVRIHRRTPRACSPDCS
jgi:hypothetical protein